MYARICQIVCRVCMLLWLCSCAVVSFSNGWYTFVERYFLWIHQYANRPPRAASSEMFSRKFANTASTIRWTFLLMPPTTSSAANFARVMELGPDNNKTQFIFFLSSSMSIHQTVAGNRNVEPLAPAVNNQTYARRVRDQVSMWVWTCESGTTIRFRALKVFMEVLCNFRLKHVRPTHPSRSLVLSTIKPMPEECTTKCPCEFGHVNLERQIGFAHWKFSWRCYVIFGLTMCVRRIRA